MNKEMEREAVINAIVELVHEVGTGNFRQQMQEKLEGMSIVLAETMASLDEKDEELTKIKAREELVNRDYEKLKRKYAALQEIFAQEEARRLEAVKSHEDEMRQRLTMEREISSLVKKYEGASEQISSLQQRVNYWWHDACFAYRHAAMLQQQLDASYEAVKSHEDEMRQKLTMEREISSVVNKYEGASEQISSLQQRVNYWWHDSCFAYRHAAMLQQQLDASYASLQFKDQEIKLLREDIEDIRQMQEIYKDTHQQPVLVQKLTGLTDELEKCKRSMENLSVVIEDFKADKNITPQTEQLVELQQQLHSMQLELQITEGEALATKQINEEHKKEIEELKDHLADVNIELFENKLLQKKLQNIIQRSTAKE